MLDLVVTNPFARLAALAAIFLLVLAAIYVGASWLSHRMAVRGKLRQIGGGAAAPHHPASLRAEAAAGCADRRGQL